MERKVYNEAKSDKSGKASFAEPSVKDRFQLPARKARDFIDGKYSADAVIANLGDKRDMSAISDLVRVIQKRVVVRSLSYC